MRLLFLPFILLIFFFSSCSVKQNQLLFEQTNTVADSTYQKSRANISNYRIKPHDILQIRNIQDSKNLVDLGAGAINTQATAALPNQQGDTYEVDDDGTVALTGIGRVQIAGLTRVEVRKYIEDIYNKKFLKDALFEVKLMNLKVTVLGEVKLPGNYLLTKDNTRLLDVLGDAGGLTDKADGKTVKIIHSDQPVPDTTVVDLSNTKFLYNPKTLLRNNDIVYVAKNKAAIKTEKVQNFSVLVQPVLLLVNTVLIIFTLARR